MKAMVLREFCEIQVGDEPRRFYHLTLKQEPLEMMEQSVPVPGPHQILVKVSACGICHTELDEIEARLVPPRLPIVLGHEIVGTVESLGPGVNRYKAGDRVGIAWISCSCGHCKFCKKDNENLCGEFLGTGLHADGGYAQYKVVSEDYAYPIPERSSDSQAAPLLCAGVIGYRALKLSGLRPGQVLGLYVFGASAHIAIQVAKYWESRVFVFARRGQKDHQNLAVKSGADLAQTGKDAGGRGFENPPAINPNPESSCLEPSNLLR